MDKAVVIKSATAIAAVIVGAIAGYLFGQVEARKATIRDERTVAYVDHMESVALANMFRKEDEKSKYLAARARRNSARYKMLLFASPEVLEALAVVNRAQEKDPAVLRNATIKWFRTMRNELHPASATVADAVMRDILWPPKAPEELIKD